MKKLLKIFVALLPFLSLSISFNSNENEFIRFEPIAKKATTVDDYFSDIDAFSLSREQLFNKLQSKVWDGWKRQSYDALDSAFIETDFVNGYLVDIYSNTSRLTPSSTGNYKNEGDTWNKEHLIPKSWWGGSKGGPNGEGGDMFNMYPTDGKINGMRSNYVLGETSNPTNTSNNGYSKLGPSSFSGYDGIVFEPNDEWKGNIARSYFYFALKYVTYTNSSYTEGNGKDVFNKTGTYGLTDYSTSLFLKWNKHLEKSQYEKERCERVYKIQNNRNPFIYHPEWADYIWGNIPLTKIEPTSLSISPSSLRLKQGNSHQLVCTVTPSNASNSIIWTSLNNDIATVSNNGLVEAKSIGKTNIKATSTLNASINASIEIEVHNDKIKIEGISLPDSIDLKIGQSKNIDVSYIPLDTEEKGYTLSINDDSIAQVISNNTLLGLKEGIATLTATSSINTSIKASTTIIVQEQKGFNLAKQVSDLEDGDSLIIAYPEKNVAAGSFKDKYLQSVSASFSSNKEKIEAPSNEIEIFSLEKNTNSFSFINNAKQKLGASSSKALQLNNGETSWTIQINEGKAIIKPLSVSQPLLYNIKSPRFKTYSKADDSLVYPSIYVSKSTSNLDKTNALLYVSAFLKKTGQECLLMNVTLNTWNDLKSEYESLSEETKSYIKTNYSSEELSEFRQRYELIINKYGYGDFIFDITPTSIVYSKNKNSGNLLPITILTSIASICLISITIIIIKKRKKN